MIFLAFVLMKTIALGATTAFTLDLAGWKTGTKVTPEQKQIATAYLDAMKVLNSLTRNNEVVQVTCVELAQDLVTTHRFFHCRISYLANAADGGPFDDGQVVAWDGKRALMHRRSDRHEVPQMPLPGEASELQKAETVSRLVFRSAKSWNELDAKDESAAKLDAALNVALDRRAAAFKPARAAATLPAWLSFALAVHFHVPSFEWQPGLPPEDEVKKQFEKAPGYGVAVTLAAERAFGGTVKFRNDGDWIVYLRFDAPSLGFGFREQIIAYRGVTYG